MPSVNRCKYDKGKCVHPSYIVISLCNTLGWTSTAGVDSAFGDNKKYLEPMRNMWQGAEGMGWLMGAPQNELVNGGFYLDRSVAAKHIAGPFFSEGSYTKNTEADVDELMAGLTKATDQN